MESIVIGIIGTAATITGLILFLLSRKEKKAAIVYETLSLIDSAKLGTEKIRVLNDEGRALELVSATRLVLWNRGRDSILREDLRNPVGKLHIDFPQSVELLDVKVEKTSRQEIAFEAHLSPEAKNRLIMTFDDLEHKDGAIIRILHTGDVAERLSISGAIRGCRGGVANIGDYRKLRSSEFELNLGSVLFFGGVISLSLGASALLREQISAPVVKLWLAWTLAAVGAAMFASATFVYGRWRNKFPPRGLAL